MRKEDILRSFSLNRTSVLNIYPHGSRVYGTNAPDSDYDYIIVGDNQINAKPELVFSTFREKRLNATIYRHDDFLNKIQQHSVSVLECICLSKVQLLLDTVDFVFTVNPKQLHASFTRKAEQDFARAEKRFLDGNIKKAKKSLFHGIRVQNFEQQILSGGIDYSFCNTAWEMIRDCPSENWNDYMQLRETIERDMMLRLEKKIS